MRKVLLYIYTCYVIKVWKEYFVSAFTGGQKLTCEEAEELKKLFRSEDK